MSHTKRQGVVFKRRVERARRRAGDEQMVAVAVRCAPHRLSLTFVAWALAATAFLALAGAGCRQAGERRSVRPRSLRDVPAERLNYRFQADTNAPAAEETSELLASVQNDFKTRRPDDALARTIVSPDAQRVLALYATSAEANGEYRIDLYGAAGNFLRNVTPANLSGAFAPVVAWSPDGNSFAFVGRQSLAPQPTPSPVDELPAAADGAPVPSASVAPNFAPVPVFNTEQIYIANRDGFDLKPLTTREGLIYFYFAWAPDNHALVALACKEDEWDAREAQGMLPAGRARLIDLDGRERYLADELTEALPVWSPDSAKVATAFDKTVGIYDAVTATPTQAHIPLSEPLLAASRVYDEKKLVETNGAKPNATTNTSGTGKKNKKTAVTNTAAAVPAPAETSDVPISFNPIVRLKWPQPDTLFIETAYVRFFKNQVDPVSSSERWHTLTLSPQAALLSNK